MTDIDPNATQNPQPTAQGIGWITITEAARRSGQHERTLRRRCEAMAKSGLARMQTPEGGGKPCWHIREDADRKFWRVQFPETIPCDLRSLTDAQRSGVEQRVKVVRGWEQACRVGFQAGKTKAKITEGYLAAVVLETGMKLTAKCLYAWNARYRKQGVAGLIDGRCKQQQQDNKDKRFGDFFVRLYLDQRQRTAQWCYDATEEKARQEGWSTRGWCYRSCLRYLERLQPGLIIRRREGKGAYEALAEPYLERDYSTLRSNELWTSDHHQFDVFVVHEGKFVRPWLTAWQDCRSRKIVGWHIGVADPNTDTILLAMRMAIKTAGVPESCSCDNGKDYDSYALQGRTKAEKRKVRVEVDAERINGIYAMLGIESHNAQPYHGQSKPIERFFGTLESRLGKSFDSYCGRSPEHRPEDLTKRLKAGQAPTLEELIGAFAEWLETDYHNKVHQGDGMDGRCPNDVFAAHLEVKRTAPEDLLDLMLFKPTRPVKVGRNGVMWNGLRYGKLELNDLLGQQVTLRVDPLNITQVHVHALDGRFLRVAQVNERIPANATAQDLREAMKEKRHVSKVMRDYPQAAMRVTEDLAGLMLANSQRKRAEAPRQPDAPPPVMQPIQSPLAAQLSAIQKEQQRKYRKAAGAELDVLKEALDLPLSDRKRSIPEINVLKIVGGS